ERRALLARGALALVAPTPELQPLFAHDDPRSRPRTIAEHRSEVNRRRGGVEKEEASPRHQDTNKDDSERRRAKIRSAAGNLSSWYLRAFAANFSFLSTPPVLSRLRRRG